MIGILGAVFTLLVAVCVSARPDRLPWLLSAAMPFVATAGYVVAGQSIVVYHIIAIVVVVLAVRSTPRGGLLGADLAGRAGFLPLVAFGLWAATVTIVAPMIFPGLPVLNPREGIDAGIMDPAELAPQISNLAQVGYLGIGIATVVAIGSMRSVSPRLPALGFTVGTVCSSTKALLPPSLQASLFDNSTNVGYTTGGFNGIERLRGVFSEPGALGSFSVAAMVFFALSASTVTGRLRQFFVAMAVWAFVNTVLTFSGGAIISGILILVVLAVRACAQYVTGRSAVSAAALVVSLLLVPTATIVGPLAYSFVKQVVDDKKTSASYENRNAADAFSYDLVHQTSGVGVGVGSNRPSSFLAMLASCTGVLGVVLFFLAVGLLLVGATKAGPQWRPVVWTLIATIVGKIISAPDLSEPVMWFLIALCAHAAWNAPTRVPHAHIVAERFLHARTS